MIVFLLVVLRVAVGLTFGVILLQLVYYYKNTRFVEFLILTARFALGLCILLLLAFPLSPLLLKLFFALFISIYATLLLFIAKVSFDRRVIILFIVYLVLLFAILLFQPITGSLPSWALVIYFDVLPAHEVLGISLFGTIWASSRHPWPFILFRFVVDCFIVYKVVKIRPINMEAKRGLLSYFVGQGLVDLLFFFPVAELRAGALLATNIYFIWMIWKYPHWIVLTKTQLLNLYHNVQRIEVDKKPKVPFTNPLEISEYILQVKSILEGEEE